MTARHGPPARIRTVLCGLMVVAGSFLGCGDGGDTAPPPADVEQGRKLYLRNCATCHGPDAGGFPNLGKALRDNEFTRGLSDAELVEFLRKGRPAFDPLNERGVDMPPRGGNPSLTGDDLRRIVAFLRTIQ